MSRREVDVDGTTIAAAPAKRRTRWRMLGGFVLLLGGILMILRLTGWLESMLFYFPSRAAFVTPRGYEDVTIVSSSGVTLHAWWMPPRNKLLAGPDGRVPAVIYVHGNAGNVEGHEAFSNFLPSRGVGVLLFDYRGYGRSSAARLLSREQLMDDTRAAYAHLRSRADVDPARIGVFAQSLGVSFGMELASEHPEIACVCAVSGFSSWNSIATDHTGWFGRFMTPPGFDAAASAGKLGKRDVLIVHGAADEIIPAKHSRVIAEAAKAGGSHVRLIEIPGGTHNEALFLPDASGRDGRAAIGDFFVECFRLKNVESTDRKEPSAGADGRQTVDRAMSLHVRPPPSGGGSFGHLQVHHADARTRTA